MTISLGEALPGQQFAFSSKTEERAPRPICASTSNLCTVARRPSQPGFELGKLILRGVRLRNFYGILCKVVHKRQCSLRARNPKPSGTEITAYNILGKSLRSWPDLESGYNVSREIFFSRVFSAPSDKSKKLGSMASLASRPVILITQARNLLQSIAAHISKHPVINWAFFSSQW